MYFSLYFFFILHSRNRFLLKPWSSYIPSLFLLLLCILHFIHNIHFYRVRIQVIRARLNSYMINRTLKNYLKISTYCKKTGYKEAGCVEFYYYIRIFFLIWRKYISQRFLIWNSDAIPLEILSSIWTHLAKSEYNE